MNKSASCPQMHTKFVQFKADADLFLNGAILSMRPYSVKYGPFQQIVKVVAPQWACCGNPKAIWDLILRLDYGPSPLNGRFELKSSFLGKKRTTNAILKRNETTKQVFHQSIIKKVPVGTCQTSCTLGLIEVLPQDGYFSKAKP